ncbi:uncharacterized protein LOC118546233 isoform X4 [Halichoerus grypus]
MRSVSRGLMRNQRIPCWEPGDVDSSQGHDANSLHTLGFSGGSTEIWSSLPITWTPAFKQGAAPTEAPCALLFTACRLSAYAATEISTRVIPTEMIFLLHFGFISTPG